MSNMPKSEPPPDPDDVAEVLHDGSDGVGQTKLDKSKELPARISDAFEDMIPGDSDDDGH